MSIEQHRHECEVRYVLAMGNMQLMAKFMDNCEKKRGKKAADRLRNDVRAIIKERKRKDQGQAALDFG